MSTGTLGCAFSILTGTCDCRGNKCRLQSTGLNGNQLGEGRGGGIKEEKEGSWRGSRHENRQNKDEARAGPLTLAATAQLVTTRGWKSKSANESVQSFP